MRLNRRLLLSALLLTGLSVAQSPITQVNVQFTKGTSAKTIKGRITGDQTIDYVVRAAGGQAMKVNLSTSNDASYFNVIPPGQTDVAIFIGSTGGNTYEGTLPSSGDYKIRVYLMRSAARRREVANYTLVISVAGQASLPAKEGETIDLAGQGKFDATGKIPCAQHAGQPTTKCSFGVARAAGGAATVVVTLPDGRKRMIFFSKGKAVGSDASQADSTGGFHATKQRDLYMISIGQERYEIPEAVVYGG